jgi:hypothetical protein
MEEGQYIAETSLNTFKRSNLLTKFKDEFSSDFKDKI